MDFQRADRLIEENQPFALVHGNKKGISFDITLDRGFPFTVTANVILSPLEDDYALVVHNKYPSIGETGMFRFNISAYDEGGDIDSRELEYSQEVSPLQLVYSREIPEMISDIASFEIWEYLIDADILDEEEDDVNDATIRNAVLDRVEEFFEYDIEIRELF